MGEFENNPEFEKEEVQIRREEGVWVWSIAVVRYTTESQLGKPGSVYSQEPPFKPFVPPSGHTEECYTACQQARGHHRLLCISLPFLSLSPLSFSLSLTNLPSLGSLFFLLLPSEILLLFPLAAKLLRNDPQRWVVD